jgi:hypothetical protein
MEMKENNGGNEFGGTTDLLDNYLVGNFSF